MKINVLFNAVFLLALGLIIVSFKADHNASLVSDVLEQTNKFRRAKGLPALIINPHLNDIAQKHSFNMARGRVGFGHGGFSGRDATARKKIKGMRRFAENVAFGASTGKQVVSMWKNSSGHRRNMLGRFKYIGIGTAKDRRGRIYYTQVFAG